MKTSSIPVLILIFLLVFIGAPTQKLNASAALVRKSATEVLEAVGKWAAKSGEKDVTEWLAKEVNKKAIAELTEKVLTDGGEEGVQRLVRLASTHGSDVIRAVDNIPSPLPVLRAFDDLPDDMVLVASRRIAAGQQGRELAEWVSVGGSKVLKAEIRHPGLGGAFVNTLGDVGFVAAQRIPESAMIRFSSHADDLAKLPFHQRNAILNLMGNKYEQMERFIGNFINNNPGKTLFTAASTTVILTNSERLFGDEKIITDADGNIIRIETKPGFFERITDNTLSGPLKTPLVIFSIFAGIALLIFASVKSGLIGLLVRRNRTAHKPHQPDHNN